MQFSNISANVYTSRLPKKGIGSNLVRTGLATAKRLGFHSVIVLGHSTVYPRFGFKPASRWGICPPFEVPDDVFFAIELVKNGLKDCGGTVEYPKEFNKLCSNNERLPAKKERKGIG